MKKVTRYSTLMVLSTVLFLALAVSVGWGYYQYNTLKEYKLESENQYKRALADLSVNADNLETDMAKAKVANSSAQKTMYLTHVWKNSDLAVKNLSILPADEVGLSNVSVFLNQVADFSKAVSRKVAGVEQLSTDEEKNFDTMHERVLEINRTIQALRNDVETQNLAFLDKEPGFLQKIGLAGNKTVPTVAEGNEKDNQSSPDKETKEQAEGPQTPTSVSSGLKQLDVSLQKYPPISYKGEMDTHYVEKPLGLPAGKVNESQAQAVAKDFLTIIGYPNAAPTVTGQSEGPMGGFMMTYQTTFLEVSKKGGVVTIFNDQRDTDERKLDISQAVKSAESYLVKLGWKLVVTSTEDLGSYIQIDAVPQTGGARLYPDKVRVMIATDNGKIIGLDTTPYYAFHHDREIKPVLTLDQAKSKLKKGLQIIENRMAVISKLGTDEAVCYEFRCKGFGEEYLVYINAKDGSEEKINRVIESPRGKLIQ
ncbi:Propeptide PepSY amd peptidase M4 [Syntrophobotulus glycolicus DSM 8271]|uniref:Propeptide PepSY amd peptidase M4 n=1 Tax=Syntrophobotulus glycolicus (strain DSM 8271 / FlGlyR) TaxID=645991 RepID=F0T2D6_SYNGF|nr:PepSY1/2 domain-containing protein [Syntrophobotulus glycolicus]ADY57564.1 Propeptide PepSY amd peptidase M4 [Syntrophobotulus glycolicus DSM 8271]